MKNAVIFFIIFLLGMMYAKISSSNNVFANSNNYQISAASSAVAWMIDTNSGEIYKVFDSPFSDSDNRIELINFPNSKK